MAKNSILALALAAGLGAGLAKCGPEISRCLRGSYTDAQIQKGYTDSERRQASLYLDGAPEAANPEKKERKKPYFKMKIGDLEGEFEVDVPGLVREVPLNQVPDKKIVKDYSTKEKAVLSEMMRSTNYLYFENTIRKENSALNAKEGFKERITSSWQIKRDLRDEVEFFDIINTIIFPKTIREMKTEKSRTVFGFAPKWKPGQRPTRLDFNSGLIKGLYALRSEDVHRMVYHAGNADLIPDKQKTQELLDDFAEFTKMASALGQEGKASLFGVSYDGAVYTWAWKSDACDLYPGQKSSWTNR